MHDSMQYDRSKVKVTSPSKWEIGHFQKLSPPRFMMGAGKWPHS